MKCDVAIIGGGPAGSTTGCYLRKYGTDYNVLILERERFPRDHVGESQLPPISRILDELGCWDKVEAANFPIKIGATYRWGKNPELWDFEFWPRSQFGVQARPAKYEGARLWTAFQVDRAIYDKILLDHALEMGCEVREETKVTRIYRDGDHIKGLELADGEIVTARHYIDASGHSGFLRRALGVAQQVPTSLQNIAIWDYWQNAEWAETIGVGGTMIQVLSVGYGWLWFIPLGPTRTSIGFITSADYYKRSGMRHGELYTRALADEARVSALIKNATAEGKLQTTNDWSFVAERMVGDNWFLVGESGGFADPILSAGLSLAQKAAQEAAFTILEIDRGEQDADWLRQQYELGQTKRIQNHIRFADYWYTANGQFEDLKDFTAKIAEENGLELTPEKAWAWIAQGGFIDEGLTIGLAGFTLEQVKEIGKHLSDSDPVNLVEANNVFELNLDGVVRTELAKYAQGRVGRCPCLVRGDRALPVLAVIDLVVALLNRNTRRPDIARDLRQVSAQYQDEPAFRNFVLAPFQQTLEAMISDGWVKASFDPDTPMTPFPNHIDYVRWLSETPAGSAAPF
ncbi:MAG: NAD(P)/FAD-dependent oxidoreductase [Fimbriimonadaceae bacterium]